MNVVSVAILTGSTRPGRNNLAVAGWLDEPMPPMLGQYTHVVSYGGHGNGVRAVEHLRLVMAELMVATVRAMLDQVIAWGRALKTVREPQIAQSEMQTI
jgi:NAD(P)H-dependent FMN reductase